MGTGTDYEIPTRQAERYEGGVEAPRAVWDALTAAEDEIGVLRELVSTLAGRLDPVMRQTATAAVGLTSGTDSPPISPMAERIRSMNANLLGLRGSLGDIIDRLDL